MLRKSGPYALLLLQLLIALVTMSLVNDSASSRDIRITSFDTWRVLLDKECLPSLEVVNWRLKLLTIILGEVWGLPVKVMPSFSFVCLDLPSIHLIVCHNVVLSVLWSMLSTNFLHCLLLWSDVALVISSFIFDSRGKAWSCLRRSSRSSIMAKISARTCCVYSLRLPVVIWWEAAFNNVAQNNFSSFWQSAGRWRELSLRSISCLYPVQSAFLRLMQVLCRAGDDVAVVCNPIRMGRWSELKAVCVCHSNEVMRKAAANETSG